MQTYFKGIIVKSCLEKLWRYPNMTSKHWMLYQDLKEMHQHSVFLNTYILQGLIASLKASDRICSVKFKWCSEDFWKVWGMFFNFWGYVRKVSLKEFYSHLTHFSAPKGHNQFIETELGSHECPLLVSPYPLLSQATVLSCLVDRPPLQQSC